MRMIGMMTHTYVGIRRVKPFVDKAVEMWKREPEARESLRVTTINDAAITLNTNTLQSFIQECDEKYREKRRRRAAEEAAYQCAEIEGGYLVAPDGNRYYYVTKSGKVYACRDRYGRSTITYVYHWKPRESYLTEVTDEVESREVYRKLAEKHPEYAVFTL